MKSPRRIHLTRLLAPGPKSPLWEAEKSGWRCFVMGNDRCHYRRRSKLRPAWQNGYDAASRSTDPADLTL
jgi:hypothetical protein